MDTNKALVRGFCKSALAHLTARGAPWLECNAGLKGDACTRGTETGYWVTDGSPQTDAGQCILSGEVHMSHKTKPPYNQWDIVAQATAESGLMHCGSVRSESAHRIHITLVGGNMPMMSMQDVLTLSGWSPVWRGQVAEVLSHAVW